MDERYPRVRATCLAGPPARDRHLPKGLSFHKGKGKASFTGRAKKSAVGPYHLKVRATNLMGKTTHRLTLVVKRG
jgi:hypothetical protein